MPAKKCEGGIIYLTLAPGGGIYIGKRRAPSLGNYYGSGIRIKRSVKKYGREAHSRAVLDRCYNEAELNEAERKWIAEYTERYPGRLLNLTKGGDGLDAETARHHAKAWWARLKPKERDRRIRALREASEKAKETFKERRRRRTPKQNMERMKVLKPTTDRCIGDGVVGAQDSVKMRQTVRRVWKELMSKPGAMEEHKRRSLPDAAARAIISQKARERWADPAYKARHSEAIRRGHEKRRMEKVGA